MKKVLCYIEHQRLGSLTQRMIFQCSARACEAFISQHPDWTYYGERLEKGVSGYKVSAGKRDAIIEIRAMAERREFDVLPVFALDAERTKRPFS